MATIHHNVSKKARRLSVSIAANADGTWTFTHDWTGMSVTGLNGKVLMDQIEEKIKARPDPDAKIKAAEVGVNAERAKLVKKAKTKAGYDENGDPKTKKTIETGKSGVMFLKYHTSYMIKGGGNGDALDVALRDAVLRPGKKGEKPALDWNALEDIADRHDVWNPKYRDLNAGMARMNVANRLRALIRNEKPVTIKGVKITEL